MGVEENPYQPTGSTSVPHNDTKPDGIGKTVYKHSVALAGALLVFVGAFLGVVGIPPMLSESIATSQTWMISLILLGILASFAAAFLSYRATLKTYSNS